LKIGQKTIDPRILIERLERLGTPQNSMESHSSPDVQETLTEESIRSGWASFVNSVAEKKMTLATALEEASLELNGRTLFLTFNKLFSHQVVSRGMDILLPLLKDHFGSSITVEIKLDTRN